MPIGVTLAHGCWGAKLEVDLVVESTVKSRLDSGDVDRRERQNAIRELFRQAGCSVEEQKVAKRSGNVICTLRGETASAIAVGGHFDFAERGHGIVDDWSGTSLLPSLYQAMKGRPRHHTFVFVAFAEEERGLIGSSRYIKSLTAEQKTSVRAFVNLECLGLGPVKVWERRSTPAVVSRLNEVAGAMGIDLQGVNVDSVGDDDTHPFLSAGIPVISVHSVTQETFRLIHSERDSLTAIHFDDYYRTYRLAAYYLAYLDVMGG